jgi:hypothetical protein
MTEQTQSTSKKRLSLDYRIARTLFGTGLACFIGGCGIDGLVNYQKETVIAAIPYPEKPAIVLNISQARDYFSELQNQLTVNSERILKQPYESENLKPIFDEKNAPIRTKSSELKREMNVVIDDVIRMQADPEVKAYEKKVKNVYNQREEAVKLYNDLQNPIRKTSSGLLTLGIFGLAYVIGKVERAKYKRLTSRGESTQ